MQPHWLHYRERGSVFAYRLIAAIARILGRPLTRLLLYPICLYYILLSRATSRASRQYLGKVFGRPARWIEIFRHHYYFAAVLLDRVYLYTNETGFFDIRYVNNQVLHQYLQGGRGCVLLSAHLGSHEFMRVHGVLKRVAISMMMYENNAQMIGNVTDRLNLRYQRRVIPIGPIDSMIIAKERVDAGEVVGILGDRVLSNEQTVRVRFFGQAASFPAGPFRVAAVLKVPVALVVSLYRGGNRYEVHFEPFADQITLDRRDPKQLERWVERYAERLEHYCRLEPYNWFNFYQFWNEAPPEPSSAQPAGAN